MINQGMLSEELYSKEINDEKINQLEEFNGSWKLNEDQLRKVFAQALLPSMGKKINIQALLVYQSDNNVNRSLMVNGCFQREDIDDCAVEMDTDVDRNEGVLLNESPRCIDNSVTLPSWTDSSTDSVPSPSVLNCKTLSDQSSSRRKRKFYRPCKIPQSIESTYSPPISQENSAIVKSELPTVSFHAPTLVFGEQNHNLPLLSETLLNALSTNFLVKAERLSSSLPTNLPATTIPFNTPRPIRPKLVADNNQSKPSSILQNNHYTTDIFPNNISAERQNGQGFETCDTEESLAAARRYAKSFVCNQCRFVFSSLNGLCEHTYSLHKAFRCTFCQAQFTQRSNLQRHSLRHVGFKPFVCGVCSKEYYRKDHLVRHIEVSHPTVDAKNSVIVKLSSAECLEYLEALTEQKHRELNMSAQYSVVSTESEANVVSDKSL